METKRAMGDTPFSGAEIVFALLTLAKDSPSSILYCYRDGTMFRSDWKHEHAAREEWQRLSDALADTHVEIASSLICLGDIVYCAPVVMPEGHTALVLEFAVGNSRAEHKTLQYEPLENPEVGALAHALIQTLAHLMDARATTLLPVHME